MNDFKICIRCKESKPETGYYLDKKRGRLMGCCRLCHMKSTNAWRKAHPETVREIDWRSKQARLDVGRVENARWREKNSDRVRARNAAFYAANREQEMERAAAYRKANPELVKAANANWRKENPELAAEKGRRRYARKRAAYSDMTIEQWKEILEEFCHSCAYCLRSDAVLTMDHIVPFARGGQHTASNVVPACGLCNSRKQAKDLLSFLVGQWVAA